MKFVNDGDLAEKNECAPPQFDFVAIQCIRNLHALRSLGSRSHP
jgi:hypothetical protein